MSYDDLKEEYEISLTIIEDREKQIEELNKRIKELEQELENETITRVPNKDIQERIQR